MGVIEAPLLLRKHRLSVAQDERMGEAGVFAPGERVELIEGKPIEPAPIGTRHAAAVKRVNGVFADSFHGRARLLLVEVSDTTLRIDRDVKLPLYAREGIGEVWIVDLENRVLRVHRQPHEGTYREFFEPSEPARLEVPALAGTTPDLAGLLAA